MSSSTLFLVSLVTLLVSLCLLSSPVHAQGQCAGVNGTTIINGPTNSNFEYYFPGADQLLGSSRTLNVTQNVTNLSMVLYFNSPTYNPTIHISLALYGPPTCGAQGDSVLLGTTSVYTLANGTFGAYNSFTLNLPLLNPVVVGPGTYTIIMETDGVNLYLLISPTVTGFTSVVADAYTKNNHSFSNANFPQTTYFVIFDQGLDTGGQIIGVSCPAGTATSPLPTCTPRPFLVYPTNSLTALPCAGTSSFLNIATFNNVTGYPFEIGQGTDLVQLTPIYLAQSQTIYSVGLLINPDTSATANYTLRPSLYLQTGPNSFVLLAQPAQLSILGSQLAGQFTELYFPLLNPPTVYGGTTVFLNVVVDQAGLVLDFDTVNAGQGGTFSGNTAVSSASTAPSSLITTTSGNPDASRGILSCAATLPAQSSSSALPPGAFSGCNGPLIINGPITDNFQYYWPVDQLLGSTRVLNVTQQIQQLQMSFYWASPNPNTVPVHVSLALYGPPTCGTQGESQLLATTAPYTFVPGQLGGYAAPVIALPLTSPLTVAAGNYTIIAESDNTLMNIITGNTVAGFQSLVADAYTKNTYVYSNATFVPTTLISVYSPGQDTLAEIISTACVTGTSPAALPTCTPRPFLSNPTNPQASLPCAGSVISQNTFSNFATFDYEVGITPNTFQLTPIVIPTTQSIQSVGILIHPETTSAPTYTVRLSLYVTNYLGPTTFSLIGQTAQTILQGSALSGQFTQLYVPLLSPITVPAGLTVYLGVVVDQYGLVLVEDVAGSSLTFSSTQFTFTSNLTSNANLTSLRGGATDISYALLGCPATLPPQSSSSNSPTPPGCYGGTVTTGGTANGINTYFGAPNFVLGSSRTLNTTQQITALSMSLYWTSSSTSTVPVAATLALYGPPNCGAQGDSVLLATTQTYNFAAGSLGGYEALVLTLPLLNPLTVAPGTYTVLVETSNSQLVIIGGASTTTFLVTDSYTLDTYTFSSGAFPASTFIAEYLGGYDTTATIIATACDNGAPLSPLPTCTPVPFSLYPASALSALPCAGTAAVYTNTYSNFTRYFDEVGAANLATRLMPITITTTQTLYEVSLLIAPGTSATTNFTLRPAVYIQTAANNYSLLASTAQTFLQGSMLSHKITEVYFPLLTPITVTAGTTIYLLRQVDQAGLTLMFDISGGTGVSGTTAINSSFPSPPFLVTTTSGGVDASRGALGCVIPPPPTQSSNLCVILYSLPGTVDYPWSVSYNVNIQYYPTPVTTSSGTAVTIESGSGTRTFINRFGTATTSPVTVAAYLPQQLGPLVYTGQAAPFDATGITFNLGRPTQLPGGDPLNPVTQTTLTFVNGAIVESGSALEDALAQAFLSGIPGVVNTTIGASNINTLAANYATCSAPISFTNGLRAPTQPSSSNGGTRIFYSYTISDGSTYSVTTSLLLLTASAFANSQDQLGSPYQTVTSISGNRTYTYLPTGATLISSVSGPAATGVTGSNPPDFRFYPYALLASSPGVYTTNSVPFLDADGLAFTVTPAAPALGSPIGFTATYSTFSVAVSIAGASLSAVLTEAPFITSRPNPSLQKQSYSFSSS